MGGLQSKGTYQIGKVNVESGVKSKTKPKAKAVIPTLPNIHTEKLNNQNEATPSTSNGNADIQDEVENMLKSVRIAEKIDVKAIGEEDKGAALDGQISNASKTDNMVEAVEDNSLSKDVVKSQEFLDAEVSRNVKEEIEAVPNIEEISTVNEIKSKQTDDEITINLDVEKKELNIAPQTEEKPEDSEITNKNVSEKEIEVKPEVTAIVNTQDNIVMCVQTDPVVESSNENQVVVSAEDPKPKTKKEDAGVRQTEQSKDDASDNVQVVANAEDTKPETKKEDAGVRQTEQTKDDASDNVQVVASAEDTKPETKKEGAGVPQTQQAKDDASDNVKTKAVIENSAEPTKVSQELFEEKLETETKSLENAIQDPEAVKVIQEEEVPKQIPEIVPKHEDSSAPTIDKNEAKTTNTENSDELILQEILTVEKEINAMKEKILHFSGTATSTEYVTLNEMLIRKIIKLDDLAVENNENVKDERKRVIKVVQQCLKNLEANVQTSKNDSESE